MANVSLGKLLGSDAARVDAILEDLTALSANVGNQPFGPLALDEALELKPGSVPVFRNQNLTLGASAKGSIEIHAPDHQARAFDIPESADGFQAPQGRSFAELKLDGRFNVEGQATVQPASLLALSLGLKAGAQFQYRHLLPVRADRPRLEGLKSVVTRSRLPHLVDFKGLAPGEVHELTAAAYLDLRASIGIEGDASFVGDLFSGLPSEVNIHVQYVAEASFGLALYERMAITAGKALLLDPSRVRLRVERESRRQLTLGARFALEVQYDLTQGLESLLEQALDLLPLPRSVETLRQVRDVAGQIGAGNWEQIKQELSTRAGQEVTELLGDAGWLSWTQTSPEVAKFLTFSRKAVEAYDSLEERLQSLWDSLLGKADLGPGSDARKLLERLSQIDPQHPELLVSDPAKRELIAAVEILGGQSLEEILLASGASQALAQVQGLAQQALRFLTDVPKDFFDTLQGFAKRTRLEQAVAWLRDNATSADKLRTSAETHVQKLVAQLAGKALDQISDADVKKIQKWAQKIHQVLMAPDVIEQKLRDRIARLKGQAGLSVAVEIDRVSRTTALLDIEFDPANEEVRKAVEKVGLRDLGGVLRELPEGNPKEEDTLPYQLRECVFTSARTRTSSISLFFSWLGWTKGSRRRVEESTVRVLPTLQREAEYSGAAVLSCETSGAQSSAAVWLTSRATGAGKDIRAPYGSATREMRLTYSREDVKSSPEELEALGVLLVDLGFAGSKNEAAAAILEGGLVAAPTTRFSIDVRLPEEAADAFFKAFSGSGASDLWLFDLLNGLHRWFNEGLVVSRVFIKGDFRPTGTVLSRALFHQDVRKAWLKSRLDLDLMAKSTPVTLRIQDENVTFLMARQVGSAIIWNPLDLQVLPISRDHADKGFKALRKVEPQITNGGLRPEDLSALSRDAAKALKAFQPLPSLWANPMLGIWTAISRLSRNGAAALGQATGLATLRWQDAAGKWAPENIHTWQLAPGAMVHDRTSGTGMFPLIK